MSTNELDGYIHRLRAEIAKAEAERPPPTTATDWLEGHAAGYIEGLVWALAAAICNAP